MSVDGGIMILKLLLLLYECFIEAEYYTTGMQAARTFQVTLVGPGKRDHGDRDGAGWSDRSVRPSQGWLIASRGLPLHADGRADVPMYWDYALNVTS